MRLAVCWCASQKRGEKADLIRLANRNAQEEAERVTSEAERVSKTLELLARMTGLAHPPRRMESYDISNTGSSDIVASMVVYEGARPKKERLSEIPHQVAFRAGRLPRYGRGFNPPAAALCGWGTKNLPRCRTCS